MIGLPLRLLAREVYNKVVDRVGRGERRADHRRGEDQAAEPALLGLPPSRRCRAISIVAFVAIDEIQLGADLERGHVFTDRMLNRRGREETLVLGAATMRPLIEKLLPGANIVQRPRLSQLTFAGEKKLTRLPRRTRHRRVLGRRGLRHRRADPPPARRRRGGARRAVAAHAQRPGRALPVRRRRLSGRHRRDRHGAQSRRRSRRLRLRPQVRRLPVPQAQPGRAGADRRPRRPRHARRHLRHHRPLPAVRRRTGAGARKPLVRAAQGAAMAQHRPRFRLARRAAGLAGDDADASPA